MNDNFQLYDLQVDVVGDPKTYICSHKEGPAFRVEGENLVFNQDSTAFSMYSLSAIIPVLPAKQRETDKNDWMTTDSLIACPDPLCKAQFKITRLAKRTFSHAAVTKTPLSGGATS
jgi:uncharacterized repeat protein (TIGR04076 family)